MANIATQILFDKDIRLLPTKEKRYFKVVGNPKELVIFISPKGIKKFAIRIKQNDKSIFKSLKEFRESIYTVADARKEAINLLRELEKTNDISILKKGNEKYKFKNLFDLYTEQKIRNGLGEDYIKRIKQVFKKYLLPSLENKDAKEIKYTHLLEIFKAIYNPHNPQASRLETIHRLINHLQGIFRIAIKDRYLEVDPSFGLKDEFMTPKRFKRLKEVDTRYPALFKEEDLKEFIKDLKNENKIDEQTKRAIYLQILSINRPINTVSVKWEHIDFEKKIWTIPANETKTKIKHEIPLNDFMLKILKEQYLFSGDKEFVFASNNTSKHIHRDTLSKAIRNLGSNKKWQEKASSHGFRATFRTICSLNKAELLKLGISEEIIESVLAHKEMNEIKYSYEREKASLKQKAKLLEWYANFLNDIENLGL